MYTVVRNIDSLLLFLPLALAFLIVMLLVFRWFQPRQLPGHETDARKRGDKVGGSFTTL